MRKKGKSNNKEEKTGSIAQQCGEAGINGSREHEETWTMYFLFSRPSGTVKIASM